MSKTLLLRSVARTLGTDAFLWWSQLDTPPQDLESCATKAQMGWHQLHCDVFELLSIILCMLTDPACLQLFTFGLGQERGSGFAHPSLVTFAYLFHESLLICVSPLRGVFSPVHNAEM